MPGAGTALVYWVLVLMALAVFIPCLLLPEYRHLQALRAAEESHRVRVAELREEVARDRRLLDGILTDPAVVARLAQRELQFRRADERAVAVEVPEEPPVPRLPSPGEDRDISQAGEIGEAGVQSAAPLPQWFDDVAARIPAIDWDRLFCDPQTSSLLMSLSLGVLVVAFAIGNRRSRDDQALEPSRN